MSKPTRVIVGLIHTLVLCLSVSSLITSFAAELRSAWQVEWDKAVKVAEEEGAVVIYMTQAFEPVFREAFQKKYPKIKVTTVTGRGPELSQRIMSERDRKSTRLTPVTVKSRMP